MLRAEIAALKAVERHTEDKALQDDMEQRMSRLVKVPGTWIELGGQAYVMPPLALGALEQMGDKLNEIAKAGFSAKDSATAIDLVHAALLRNHPDVTRQQVADSLDLGNIDAIFRALMASSGLVRSADKPEPAQGELIEPLTAAVGSTSSLTSLQ